MFLLEIDASFRVVETRYGNGEAERNIPLGSWRKGHGLAGSRGNAYIHGPDTAGVWLIRQRAAKWVAANLSPSFPNLWIMQDGGGECTFRVPLADLWRLLPMIGAKRRAVASPKTLAALERARQLSPVARGQNAKTAPGSIS